MMDNGNLKWIVGSRTQEYTKLERRLAADLLAAKKELKETKAKLNGLLATFDFAPKLKHAVNGAS